MTTYSVLGKSWRCRKCLKGYCRFGQVLGRNRGFLVMTEFLVLCRDKGSLCHDMVIRLQAIAWSRHSTCHDSALFLCCDDVATVVSLSRPRRPQQEVRCCTLRVATSLVLVGISLSRQSIFML